ncbi:hypothetical protein ACGH2B_08165 [Streptomyces sp. BBFR2]|uniref:hypothetical protein n=1 Tax=Streptomyces sp. BBFR2 TaxID=3372854 RepID=UPI0037D9E652
MSRESDSSSSGPQGRGSAVYPSGTPPYGTAQGAGEAARGAAAQPEEQKTETTLTTRIKINIPGSRPIPPVVVRKPVDAGEETGVSGADGTPGEGTAPGPGPAAEATGGQPRLPRRSPAAQRPGGAPGRPGAPSGSGETTSSWFAPRKGQSASSTTGSHPAPGASSTTGSHAAPGDPSTTGSHPAPGAAPGRPDLPYFSDGPGGGGAPSGGDDPLGLSPFDGGARPARETSPFDTPAPGAASPFDAPADLSPFDTPAGAGPAGPTTGPARGDSPVNLPPGFSDPGARTPSGGAPAGITGGLAAGPAGGVSAGPAGPKPSPKGPQGTGPRAGGRGSDTLVGGIPKVPAADGPSPREGKDGAAAAPAPLPKIPEPINPPKKKGRNKLVLAGAGVVVLAAVAYGAGLLLDHADVPNNTTALGVDIGGQAKDDAVKKLEAALKDRTGQPLKLTVDGAERSLDPVKAGLGVDVQATVRGASGRDYNPVSVIGSLFGVARTAQPAMTTDDEKLEIALRQVAGGSGGTGEGGITFSGGRAVPHYGKPHKAVDVAASKAKVADAYRQRVTTGTQPALTLAASTQQPRVSKEAVDKALKQFAEPAMSGLITVRTDAAHTVSFSPEKSIPKFLSFRPGADGSLVPYYDRAALKALYGDTFNGVLLTKGDGSKKPVTPAEVASAVQLALQGTTPADRVQTIGAG